NWESNSSATIYGYRVHPGTATCPVFVTLHKGDEVSASTAYEDELIDPSTLLWYSKSNRRITSGELEPIITNAVKLHVFVQKEDADGPDHYYLGEATAQDPEETTMQNQKGQDIPVVRMHLKF